MCRYRSPDKALHPPRQQWRGFLLPQQRVEHFRQSRLNHDPRNPLCPVLAEPMSLKAQHKSQTILDVLFKRRDKVNSLEPQKLVLLHRVSVSEQGVP